MIDKAFMLAVITSDMATAAIGLFGAACCLFIFVFPHRFVKSTDREGHAAKIGFERLGALLAPNGFFQASEISGTPQVHEKVRKKHRCDARFVLQSVHESANPGFSGKKCDCLLQDRISPWLFPWIFHLPVASCTLRML